MVFDTKHALGLKTAQGVEILLHIGIDTVKLNGEHFETHVQVGDQVKKGELLVTFDDKAIVDAGYLLTTPMVIANTYEYQSIEAIGIGEIRLSEDILKIKG